MSTSNPSYLIVGAGIIGSSTALHLKKQLPTANVQLIDRTVAPCPSAASHDLNKIVRADYADPFYMRLALEAVHLWRTDPIYHPYYHESGMLLVDDIGWGASCLKNYKLLNTDVGAHMIDPPKARERFDIFAHAKWDGVTQCYWNPSSGWAEADLAVASCLNAAAESGVQITVATLAKLLTDDTGKCIGIAAEDGTEFKADHVLLCTGAYTSKVLADSFPTQHSMQVGKRMVAAGAVSCSATFASEEIDKMHKAPVLINAMPHTHGESVPPMKDGRLKFNYEVSFTNMILHEASNQTFSTPPKALSQSTWTQALPQKLKDEAKSVMINTYSDTVKDLQVESYRICWDAVTPDQNWIISPHPHCENLYIATGGSFHSWKFLPNIGLYVTQMLLGTLDEEMKGRWAWDRQHDGGACPMYLPTRDIKDL